jgi:hypothetical protein
MKAKRSRTLKRHLAKCEENTELYYITGGPARHKKVSPKTWRILRHFHDNTSEIFMVTATDQPRS